MDYIAQNNGGHRAKFHTKDEGVAWIHKQIADWRSAGSPRIPCYELHHNGHVSTLLFSSDENGQTKDITN